MELIREGELLEFASHQEILPSNKDLYFTPAVLHQFIDTEKYNSLPANIRGICDLHHSGIKHDIFRKKGRFSPATVSTACRVIYHSLCLEEFKDGQERYKCLINWLSSDHDDKCTSKRPGRIKKAMDLLIKCDDEDGEASEIICQYIRSELFISDVLKGSGGSSRKVAKTEKEMGYIKDVSDARKVFKRGFVSITPAVAMIHVGNSLIKENSKK